MFASLQQQSFSYSYYKTLDIQPKNSTPHDSSKYHITHSTKMFWRIDYPSGSSKGGPKVGYTNSKAILNNLNTLRVFADTDDIVSKWNKQEVEEGGSITEEGAVKQDGDKHIFKKNMWITKDCKEEGWITKGCE
ncbi:hypothetical protein TUN199_08453 [Pyrenophora tritici-repentis]|nr:hypothetical protein PtrV1_09448 [Pyrenophora tritici-repentis]KAI0609731.1 hypothetical protein TUN205_06019 [Pyrenophora tritici-repentis]KAI0619557.1 hypothetical protein TUN199_08453 [Pyrenophora tritici-repentis]KAI1565822.1 hypothetical protein PtrEW4_008004 [Pyrenophora tritici-repentis]